MTENTKKLIHLRIIHWLFGSTFALIFVALLVEVGLANLISWENVNISAYEFTRNYKFYKHLKTFTVQKRYGNYDMHKRTLCYEVAISYEFIQCISYKNIWLLEKNYA